MNLAPCTGSRLSPWTTRAAHPCPDLIKGPQRSLAVGLGNLPSLIGWSHHTSFLVKPLATPGSQLSGPCFSGPCFLLLPLALKQIPCRACGRGLSVPAHLSSGGSWGWFIVTSHLMVRSVHAQLLSCVCDPMDCNLRGSSVCGISQARILEWAAISWSRGSS